MKFQVTRFTTLDALKSIAAQLVVLHHLSAYGPLAVTMQEAYPTVVGWLFDYARMAVQIFLVIGGYLAARALAPAAVSLPNKPWAPIADRYLRLVVPYMAALMFAIVCASVARLWLVDEFIPNSPTSAQILAHSVLLHGLLGYEALSAGIWYIAIDFQLFALMAILLWMGHLLATRSVRLRHAGVVFVIALLVLSLFWFNREATLDNWAPYFFAAYGLGAVTYWASRWQHLPIITLVTGVVAAALMVDFRGRILLALAVVLVLACSRRFVSAERLENSAWVSFWHAGGRNSYALFLVHFPICLLANALFVRLGYFDPFASPWAAPLGMAAAWLVSNLAAVWFYQWIERPAASLRIHTLHRFGHGLWRTGLAPTHWRQAWLSAQTREQH